MMKHQIFDFSTSSEPDLSVIITFRTNGKYDMLERLNYRPSARKDIEFVVVDDGSSREDSYRAKEICRNKGYKFIRIDSEGEQFSAGRARNIGVIYSSSEYIVHEDIDLYPLKDYYDDILQEILTQNLRGNIADFISVPVFYLTEQASEEVLKLSREDQKSFIHRKLLNGEDDFFSFCMPASSVIIVNRHHYLSLGGYDESFVKWGLEDLDYAYRLTRSSNKFHTARSYRELVVNPPFAKQTEYKGWRAQFRLFGEECYRKGIFLVHIHHPIDRKWRNKNDHGDNQIKFKQNIESFEKNKYFLPPLLAPENGRTLMFGKGCFVYNRKIFPIWGEVVLKPYEFFLEHDIVNFVEENHITRIVFTNPYASEIRTNVYKRVKEANIPFYVVERGALRDSIFVDRTGFCCESTLYRDEIWNHAISEEYRFNARQYIQKEKTESASLERQGQLIGPARLRQELDINPSEKVIFVALQSRSDTTTNFFAGKVGSFDNFVDQVNELANKIGTGWRIVAKHHPLSKIKENFDKTIIVADNYNIKDLLSLCDYVITMNSGVGVLAALFGKPVIHMAHAFYRSDLLNRYASNADEVLQYLRSGFVVEQESVERFVSYLINEFYCFGKMKTKNNENYSDKARLTITTGIDYYIFRVDGKEYFNDTRSKPIDYSSPLYDPFRHDIVNTIRARKLVAQPQKNIKVDEPTQGSSKVSRKDSKVENKTDKRTRLWNKFKSNPKKYCLDSKYRMLNVIGKFLRS